MRPHEALRRGRVRRLLIQPLSRPFGRDPLAVDNPFISPRWVRRLSRRKLCLRYERPCIEPLILHRTSSSSPAAGGVNRASGPVALPCRLVEAEMPLFVSKLQHTVLGRSPARCWFPLWSGTSSSQDGKTPPPEVVDGPARSDLWTPLSRRRRLLSGTLEFGLFPFYRVCSQSCSLHEWQATTQVTQ